MWRKVAQPLKNIGRVLQVRHCKNLAKLISVISIDLRTLLTCKLPSGNNRNAKTSEILEDLKRDAESHFFEDKASDSISSTSAVFALNTLTVESVRRTRR